MLDKLFDLIHPVNAVEVIGNILENVDAILSHFEQDYMRDPNTKNAAIDCIIQLLEKHKEPVNAQENNGKSS